MVLLIQFRNHEKLRPNVLDELGISAAIDCRQGIFLKETGIGSICDLPNEELILDKEKSTAISEYFRKH